MRRIALFVALVASLHLGCKKYDADDYVLSPSALDSVLTIRADRSQLPADGFTRTLVRAQITPEATATFRTVKFTTNAGTLYGPASGKDVDIIADAAGVAVISLESEKTLRTALVRAKIGDVIRETTVEFVAVTPSDVVTVTTSATTVPADGRSAARIVASVAPGLPAASKRVQFVTTLGTFAESNSQSFTPAGTINDQAGVDVRSAERGPARVTAQVDGVGAEITVQFVNAPPERITVSPAAVLVAPGDALVTVTVQLLRSIGTPTEGQIISYTALTPDGLSVGQFSGIQRSNATGSATVSYSARGVTYRGPVRITATVGTVSASADIQIVNP